MKRRYQLPASPYRRVRINGELRGRDTVLSIVHDGS